MTISKSPRVLFGLVCLEEVELVPGLFYCVDHAGMPRLHDGTKFRGYVSPWSVKRRQTWRVDVFKGADVRFRCGTYRTQRGAIAALKRVGIKQHQEG